MVRYRLIDIDDEGRLIYEYLPEDRDNETGTVALDPVTGEVEILTIIPENLSWYAVHTASDLRKRWNRGDKEPEGGFVAWY